MRYITRMPLIHLYFYPFWSIFAQQWCPWHPMKSNRKSKVTRSRAIRNGLPLLIPCFHAKPMPMETRFTETGTKCFILLRETCLSQKFWQKISGSDCQDVVVFFFSPRCWCRHGPPAMTASIPPSDRPENSGKMAARDHLPLGLVREYDTIRAEVLRNYYCKSRCLSWNTAPNSKHTLGCLMSTTDLYDSYAS